MHSSKLIHRVTPQRPKAAAPRNASNERNLRDDAAWENLGGPLPHWARVTPLTGSERVVAYTLEASRTHTVELRYDAITTRIDHTSRLVWHTPSGDRILAVVTCDDVEGRHVTIKCNCIEVLS